MRLWTIVDTICLTSHPFVYKLYMGTVRMWQQLVNGLLSATKMIWYSQSGAHNVCSQSVDIVL
jgi:hypothetical protein